MQYNSSGSGGIAEGEPTAAAPAAPVTETTPTWLCSYCNAETPVTSILCSLCNEFRYVLSDAGSDAGSQEEVASTQCGGGAPRGDAPTSPPAVTERRACLALRKDKGFTLIRVADSDEEGASSNGEEPADADDKSPAEPSGTDPEADADEKSSASVEQTVNVNVNVRINAIDASPSGNEPEPVARATTPPPTTGASSSGGPAPSVARTRPSPVLPGTTPGVWARSNLNEASHVQIKRTPQIGQALTMDLLEKRPFKTWEEIGSLTGIGPVRLANLQSRFYIPQPEDKPKDQATRR